VISSGRGPRSWAGGIDRNRRCAGACSQPAAVRAVTAALPAATGDERAELRRRVATHPGACPRPFPFLPGHRTATDDAGAHADNRGQETRCTGLVCPQLQPSSYQPRQPAAGGPGRLGAEAAGHQHAVGHPRTVAAADAACSARPARLDVVLPGRERRKELIKLIALFAGRRCGALVAVVDAAKVTAGATRRTRTELLRRLRAGRRAGQRADSPACGSAGGDVRRSARICRVEMSVCWPTARYSETPGGVIRYQNLVGQPVRIQVPGGRGGPRTLTDGTNPIQTTRAVLRPVTRCSTAFQPCSPAAAGDVTSVGEHRHRCCRGADPGSTRLLDQEHPGSPPTPCRTGPRDRLVDQQPEHRADPKLAGQGHR